MLMHAPAQDRTNWMADTKATRTTPVGRASARHSLAPPCNPTRNSMTVLANLLLNPVDGQPILQKFPYHSGD